jgi:acetyl-CoA carboxylase biotin carboxyl carrier protein
MKNPVQEPQDEFTTGVDLQIVEALGQAVQKFNLTEIELEQGDLKIRVARQISAAVIQHFPEQAPAVAVPAANAAPQLVTITAQTHIDHPGTVKSPMVGTFFQRPSPGATAFVEIGSHVKAGDKILLIEAMKTFNEIVAPRAGTVTSIFVKDGQPVEYGQPLMVIE